MTKSKPLVSIVMPTYNHGHYIAESLNSIIMQTYQNFEVIVVDNCSSDCTEHVVKSFEDPRVSYFKINNGGVVAVSRNFGISLSRGEWIAFLDSDDVWHPSKLACQFACFSGYDLIYTGMRDFAEKYPKLHVPINPKILGLKKIRLLAGNPIANSSVICRAKVLKQFPINENPHFSAVEDFDLWLRIVLSGARVAKVNAELLLYRKSNAQISSSKIKMVSKVFNLYRYHFNFIYAGVFTLLYLFNSIIRTLRSAK
jgi:teichuronic acid biosynthesis glycosyltransferase TuaG